MVGPPCARMPAATSSRLYSPPRGPGTVWNRFPSLSAKVRGGTGESPSATPTPLARSTAQLPPPLTDGMNLVGSDPVRPARRDAPPPSPAVTHRDADCDRT